MQGEVQKRSNGAWVEPLLAHLKRIQPKHIGENGAFRGDTRAFAALRASARGKRFVLQALPYVVPYLGETYTDPSPRVVERAMALAQLYATSPPDGTTTYSDRQGESLPDRGQSIGRKLGQANVLDMAKSGATSPGGEEKHIVTRWERRLQALVRLDTKRLVRDLRGTLSFIAKETGGMTFEDYRVLGYDLVRWDNPDKQVQMRWVTDFYAKSTSRIEHTNTKKETNDD